MEKKKADSIPFNVNKDGKCTISGTKLTHPYEDVDGLMFSERDLSELLIEMELNTPILSIDEVFTTHRYRKQGEAKKFLAEVCEEYKDHVILLTSGALKAEYIERPSDDEIMDIINDIDGFITKCGFVDVNKVIGNYEQYRRSYIYNSETSKPVLEKISSLSATED